MPDRADGIVPLYQAFDEARFGVDRILNLRASLPRPKAAEARAEAWLRGRQAAGAGEVLVITGRGNQSFDGVSAVREAIVRLLASLKRRGVVANVETHTPGSFIVTLATMKTLLGAPRRSRDHVPPPIADPKALLGLSVKTRALLRQLALAELDALGMRDPEHFLEDQMLRQFARISAAIAPGENHEARFREAVRRALDEYENG